MRTDDSGYFAFPSLPARQYWMEVRRLGYTPYAGLVALPSGTFAARVDLEPIARELPVVVTTATAMYRDRMLEAGGFLLRQRIGFGHFLDPAEIAKLKPQSVRELLAPYLRGCTMMYMNGHRGALPPGPTVEEVVGVEVYSRSAMAPLAFINPRPDCGSIVVWFAPPPQ